MKKNLMLIILFLLMCGGGSMAGNKLSNKGYVGNLSITVTPQLEFGVDVMTSHGYSFGNGLWIGGGAGVSYAGYYDGIFLPIYTEAKFTFMKDMKASPFVDCKFGIMTDTENFHTLFSPTFGVDINRISVFALYNMWSNVRSFNLGFAVNF